VSEGLIRRDGQRPDPSDHFEVPFAGAERIRAFERRRRNTASATRLLERDEWQAEFAAALAGLLPPSAVIIEGEPGVGKTALLNAACHLAVDAGYEVLRASGGVLEAEAPFGVVRQLLQPIQEELPPHARKTWVQLSSEHNGNRRPMPFDAIQDLYLTLADLASRQPLVIAVDDLHWSDIESLWWVQHLVRRLGPSGLFFVGTSLCRVAGTALGPVDNIVAEPSTRVISLRPLAAPSVEVLIRHHLDVEPEAWFVASCLRITDGNPFLLHSLLIALRQQGLRWEVSEEILSAMSPPPVARAILTRLAGLPPESQALLRAAAVLGDGSGYRTVAELAGIDAAISHDIANSLAEAHLLRKGSVLSFVHPLERSTVYGEIDPVLRARVHAEAARLLDQNDAPIEDVARHLLSSEPSDDEWSAETLEQAARLYSHRGQYELAEKCLSRSLRESSDVSARSRRLLALASTQAATGRPGALALLREAADLGADPIALADATYSCLKAYAQEVYPPDTVATLRHLGGQLGDNDELRIWIEIVLATWGPPSGTRHLDTKTVKAALDKRRLERNRHDRMALAHLSYVKCLAPERLDANYVATLAEQSLDPGDFQPEDGTSVVVSARALITLARTGRFDLVDRLGQVMQDAALSQDHATSVAEFSTVLALSHFLQGNLAEAETECRRAIGAAEGVSWASRPLAIGVLAASLMEEGRTTEAETALKVIRPKSAPLRHVELQPLEQRARLKLGDGYPNEALDDALTVKSGAERLGIINPAFTSWRSTAALALHQLGRLTEARDLADENLELARAFMAPLSLGEALRTAADVGHTTRRIELLEEAVDVLKRSGAALEYAKATIDLGAVHASEGRQDEALRSLRRGADLASRCKAQPLIDRAFKELRAAGARPRRLALMGSDALTPAERRVATLAADGLINAQIAEKLFVSEKTVEGHLTRVYHKLGNQSRAELREVLKPAPEGPSERRPSKGQISRAV
jgi:DNA-binding CsgD family transcriptional regulator